MRVWGIGFLVGVAVAPEDIMLMSAFGPAMVFSSNGTYRMDHKSYLRH
jgi:hypothetical protein